MLWPFKRPAPVPKPSLVGRVFTVQQWEFLPTARPDGRLFGGVVDGAARYAEHFRAAMATASPEERAAQLWVARYDIGQGDTTTAEAGSRLEVIGENPIKTPSDIEGEWVLVKNLTHPAMAHAWIPVSHLAPAVKP